MLNPNLNFDECLAHVQSGTDVEHIDEHLGMQKDAIVGLEEMIRALIFANSPLLVRGENLGMFGNRPFRPDEGDFNLGNWVQAFTERGLPVSEQMVTALDSIGRTALGPIVGYLQECAEWDYENYCERTPKSAHYYQKLSETVYNAVQEFCRNAAAHGSSSSSSSLWVSSNGLLVSAEQKLPFDIHAEYAHRMALPPDVDPLGREIPRPKYWFDAAGAGNPRVNRGWIRGKGLTLLASAPEVEVHSERLPEDDDYDKRTRIFLFSREPFKT